MKSIGRILEEAVGPGSREIAPGVWLAPPPAPPKRQLTEIEQALEELL